MLLQRWPKKIVIILLIFVSFYIGFIAFKTRIYNVFSQIKQRLHMSQATSLYIENKHNFLTRTSVPWAQIFNNIYFCPVCFGYGMCNDVMKSSVLFHGELSLPENTRIMWKKGVLQTRRVLISSLSTDEWNKFDQFICRNATFSVPCNLSAASWRTVLVSDDLLNLNKFKNLNNLLDIPYNKLSLPVCSTEKLILTIMKSFDENVDGQFSNEERIMLLTSLIMQPGYVILMLQSKTQMTMPFPNLLGACGRSVILEGGVKPLLHFLSNSFDVRAGLAVQVLQLVEDFEEEDPQWYFFYLGFSLEGIIVTKDGEVVVIDMDNFVILDKSTFSSDLSTSYSGLCNEVCFQKITIELFYSKNTSSCSHVIEYGQLMYALVCKQVLSDIGEHKTEGFFNFDGHRIHKRSKKPGLLHSIPFQIKEHIEELLRECVQESKPNNRKAVVSELKEILENYVNVNEFDGRNGNEDTLKNAQKKI